MKKRSSARRTAVFALAAGLGLGPARAATPLTWSDCVKRAEASNPDLAAALRSRESSRASYYGSFNGLLPQVGLTNSYTDSGGPGSAESSRWEAAGTVSLDLLNASRFAGVKTAGAALSLASANLRQVSSTVRFDLRKAFAQLLYAQSLLQVSRNIRDMRFKSAQLVTLRYHSGRESKGNMMRAKAQLLQADAELDQAGRDVRVAQRALDRQLGLDDFEEVVATGAYMVRVSSDLPRDEEYLLGRRPDIAVQEAAVRVAESGLTRSRSSLWPSLSANYARSAFSDGEFPSAYGWSLSGVLSYPIFGGGPTDAYFSISAARKSLESARQSLRAAREQALVDIETSWSDLAGAVDQTRVQTALLEAARQRNAEADVRYASGLMSYDNWEIIASDRVNQERQEVQARLNALDAQAAWEKALGKSLEE